MNISPCRFTDMRLGRVFAVLFSIAGIAIGSTEEKNGLAVSVTRKISVKSPAKNADDDELLNLQTLSLSAKSTSIRNFPEGTVTWTVLRRGIEDGHVKYTGTEVLPPLRPVQSTDLQFGNIRSWRMRGSEREKFEYEVIVSHDGKETLRVTSCANFASLAAAAIRIRGADGEGRLAGKGRRGEGEDGPAGDEAKPRAGDKEAIAKAAETAKVPEAKTPPPPAPATPAATELRKVGADVAPVPQGFDFFNLGGKKAPTEK